MAGHWLGLVGNTKMSRHLFLTRPGVSWGQEVSEHNPAFRGSDAEAIITTENLCWWPIVWQALHCARLGDLWAVIREIAMKVLWGLGCKSSLLTRELERVPWRQCYGAESGRIKNDFYSQRMWGGWFVVGELTWAKMGRLNLNVWLGWDELCIELWSFVLEVWPPLF